MIDAIKKMIIDDGFKPGDKFYSENELTRKLEVSRSSVREAMRMLEFSGQVTVKHGKGIFVSDAEGHQLKAFSHWLKNNEQSIKDNFEVRLIIEPKAAGIAALNATDEEIQRLGQICQQFAQMAKDQNTESIIKCDRRFHRVLAASTGNKTLEALMKSMSTSAPNGWISSLYTPGRIEKTVHEHQLIVDAIKVHDLEAAEQAMTDHLTNALNDVNAQIRKEE